MKKLILLMLIADSVSYATDTQNRGLKEFGTLVGGALCGDTADIPTISSCASFGGAAGALFEPSGSVCETANQVVSDVRSKLEQLGLGQYIFPNGVKRAYGLTKTLCQGPNGILPVNQGSGYISIAVNHYISSARAETDKDASSDEGVLAKIIIEAAVKVLRPELERVGNRISAETTPERLREQLGRWLAYPKDSMCRGDFTHGDIGSLIAKIVGC